METASSHFALPGQQMKPGNPMPSRTNAARAEQAYTPAYSNDDPEIREKEDRSPVFENLLNEIFEPDQVKDKCAASEYSKTDMGNLAMPSTPPEMLMAESAQTQKLTAAMLQASLLAPDIAAAGGQIQPENALAKNVPGKNILAGAANIAPEDKSNVPQADGAIPLDSSEKIKKNLNDSDLIGSDADAATLAAIPVSKSSNDSEGKSTRGLEKPSAPDTLMPSETRPSADKTDAHIISAAVLKNQQEITDMATQAAVITATAQNKAGNNPSTDEITPDNGTAALIAASNTEIRETGGKPPAGSELVLAAPAPAPTPAMAGASVMAASMQQSNPSHNTAQMTPSADSIPSIRTGMADKKSAESLRNSHPDQGAAAPAAAAATMNASNQNSGVLQQTPPDGQSFVQTLTQNTGTPDRLTAEGAVQAAETETASTQFGNIIHLDKQDAARSAPASAPARPEAAPHHVSPPIRDIAIHISQHADTGANRFQLRLDPPELGRVEVRMEISAEGKLSAVIAVERPETLDLLQRDSRALERSLLEAGLRTDGHSLSFSLKGGRHDQQDGSASRSGPEGDAPGALLDAWDDPAMPGNARFANRAVNIRI